MFHSQKSGLCHPLTSFVVHNLTCNIMFERCHVIFLLGGAVNGTGFRKTMPREVKLEDVAEEYRDIVLQNIEPYHTLRKLRIKPLEVPE